LFVVKELFFLPEKFDKKFLAYMEIPLKANTVKIVL